MSVEVRRRLLIDRISMLVELGSEELYKFVYAQLHGMQDEQASLLPTGKILVRYQKYKTRLDWYPQYTHSRSGRRKIADIEIGATKIKGQVALYRFLKVTLYPSQFRSDELAHFRFVFDTLLQEFTYAGLFAHGKVTSLELAADTLSHQQHSFLPYRTHSRASSIFIQDDGHHGTTYIGSNISALRFRIYDKRKQLHDTGKATFTKLMPHTRIEAAMRRLGVSPANLLVLENPFAKLRIADLAKANALFSNGDQIAFLSECMTYGVQSALAKRSKHHRAKYRGMLDSIPVTWWHPDEIWKDLSQALAVIAP